MGEQNNSCGCGCDDMFGKLGQPECITGIDNFAEGVLKRGYDEFLGKVLQQLIGHRPLSEADCKRFELVRKAGSMLDTLWIWLDGKEIGYIKTIIKGVSVSLEYHPTAEEGKIKELKEL